MVEQTRRIEVGVPPQRGEPVEAVAAEPDHRPRFLRWLLPMACASAVPLNGLQQAELKLIAFH